ncbi:hypothetical protein SAMN04488115_108125 [Bosea lathyri]|uniref:Uncharacterized protein n=1 Tax=Bosea lathyri TaxID=1036778 RepID=A0A1H6BX72_9HYPH|nr:hypothetical protein SAMN04488115_108125 [Bosea lathyri]
MWTPPKVIRVSAWFSRLFEAELKRPQPDRILVDREGQAYLPTRAVQLRGNARANDRR